MKQVYLVRANGEKCGPYEYENDAPFPYVSVEGTNTSSAFLKILGFTIEHVEDKPKVAYYWYLHKESSNWWQPYLITEEQAAPFRPAIIRDPSRPDPVYLEVKPGDWPL